MKAIVAKIAVAGLFVLAGCGSGNAPSTDDQPPPPVAGTGSPPASDSDTMAPAPPPDDPVLAARLAALPAPYNEASYATGRRLYRQCQSCHLADDGAGHLVGPNLHAIIGREAAALDDFNYSRALRDARFTWTAEEIDAWLADPRGYLPGNRMTFAGFRKPSDRRDVIAYLMLVSAPQAQD